MRFALGTAKRGSGVNGTHLTLSTAVAWRLRELIAK